MAAIIHVKLTGEGDFGPVDLECAIPPARLPVVMAALFGAPAAGGAVPAGAALHSGGADVASGGGGQMATHGPDTVRSGAAEDDLCGSSLVDPASFLTGYIGTLGDLVGRLLPRGFAETILIAAIWLHYRDGRSILTRDDIRRVLKNQEHLRLPRNFSRDFHVALMRGYLAELDAEGGYAVTGAGYQWFRNACMK